MSQSSHSNEKLKYSLPSQGVRGRLLCVPGQIHMASSAVLTYLRDFFLPVTLCLSSYFTCCPLLFFHGYL